MIFMYLQSPKLLFFVIITSRAMKNVPLVTKGTPAASHHINREML